MVLDSAVRYLFFCGRLHHYCLPVRRPHDCYRSAVGRQRSTRCAVPSFGSTFFSGSKLL